MSEGALNIKAMMAAASNKRHFARWFDMSAQEAVDFRFREVKAEYERKRKKDGKQTGKRPATVGAATDEACEFDEDKIRAEIWENFDENKRYIRGWAIAFSTRHVS